MPGKRLNITARKYWLGMVPAAVGLVLTGAAGAGAGGQSVPTGAGADLEACPLQPPEMGPRTHSKLSAAWSDARILQAFKLDIAQAERQETIGIDGDSLEYTFPKNKVIISRTLHGNVIVILVRKGAESVVWKLKRCPASADD